MSAFACSSFQSLSSSGSTSRISSLEPGRPRPCRQQASAARRVPTLCRHGHRRDPCLVEGIRRLAAHLAGRPEERGQAPPGLVHTSPGQAAIEPHSRRFAGLRRISGSARRRLDRRAPPTPQRRSTPIRRAAVRIERSARSECLVGPCWLSRRDQIPRGQPARPSPSAAWRDAATARGRGTLPEPVGVGGRP